MANYCENTITFSDFEREKDKEIVTQKIERFIKEEKSLIQMAITDKAFNELASLKDPFAIPNKLGTKWIIAYSIEYNDDWIEIIADSAWAPPTGWAKILSKKYKCKIRIKFDEPGMGFMGAYKTEKGEVLKDSCIDY